MFKRIILAVTAVAATVGPIALRAQIVPPSTDTPSFEAVSVRPAADTGRRGDGERPVDLPGSISRRAN